MAKNFAISAVIVGKRKYCTGFEKAGNNEFVVLGHSENIDDAYLFEQRGTAFDRIDKLRNPFSHDYTVVPCTISKKPTVIIKGNLE